MTTRTVQSGEIPQDIRILSDKVLVATDIHEISVPADDNGETVTMYEFKCTEYGKDEYIGLLNEQLTDTQLALTELYEEMTL